MISRRPIIAGLLLLPLLAACGKRGRLRQPEGVEATYPRFYPNRETVVPPAEKAEEPFIELEPDEFEPGRSRTRTRTIQSE
jgi:hypothetical protein